MFSFNEVVFEVSMSEVGILNKILAGFVSDVWTRRTK
jgi:hypothetical protein